MRRPSRRPRGFIKDILAVLVGLVIPIVIIVGGYYLWNHLGDTGSDAPAPVTGTEAGPPPVEPPAPPPPEPPPPQQGPRTQDQPRSRQPEAPTYPTPAKVAALPGDPGDMYLMVPEEPVAAGESFTVDLYMNGGEKIIAATTMYVHFDPLVLEYKGVQGALTDGSKSPLATNMISAGNLVISDINTPRAPQPGESPYNTEMTGPVKVYALTFQAVGAPGDASYIGGGSSTFHDPGGDGRRPTAIGEAPFPRTTLANAREITIK